MSETLEKRWTAKAPASKEEIGALAKAINVRPVLARLLWQRAIDDFDKARSFFRPSLDELHDPFLFKDMDKAVARLSLALEQSENIMIYGDYDVDGTTSVALVYSFLSAHYEQLMYYIPDRYTEGYGLSTRGIDQAEDNDVSLIITLDCGIKAIDKVEYAKSKGIDIIICDHHRPGDEIPQAVAVLDAKQSDCTYPYDELCGCGVGFKFMQAMCREFGWPEEALYKKLDLVATAIGADIVPITGENRILMYHGLHQINERPSIGMASLMRVAEVKKKMTVTDLVFMIAPRINAAGRIAHGNQAVALLCGENESMLDEVAREVNTYNQERKELDRAITEQALEMIRENAKMIEAKSTVVYHPDWHKGVVGIVASRLTESYYRPTIVLTESQGKVTGSARSVRHFDVYEAIDSCSDLLENFGGHKYAAGLTMSMDKVEAFRARFEEVVSASIEPEWLIPEIGYDMEVELSEINWKFYNVIKQMAPFGPGNMKPVFRSNVCQARYAKIVGSSHLKFRVSQKDSPSLNTIAFGLGDKLDLIDKDPFDILYTVEENEWNGQVSLQLNVKDIRESGQP